MSSPIFIALFENEKQNKIRKCIKEKKEKRIFKPIFIYIYDHLKKKFFRATCKQNDVDDETNVGCSVPIILHQPATSVTDAILVTYDYGCM